MPLFAIVIDAAADPAVIAQCFAGRPGFAFLHRMGEGERGRSFVACDPVETSSLWLPPANGAARTAGAPTERGLDTRLAAPRWIGAIPYECARSLERARWTREPDRRAPPFVARPIWSRYGAVAEIEPGGGLVRVVGDDQNRVAAMAAAIRRAPMARPARRPVRVRALEDDDPPSAHLDRIRSAQELIRAGDLYQVNLARRRRFAIEGAELDVYRTMAEGAPARFGACLDLGGTYLYASSPELFLAFDPSSGRIETAPIKGTRPRGEDAAADAKLRRELDESTKEQAELTMIVDVERNDLGKVALPGSVRVLETPRVATHPTIHHRAAVLDATARPGTSPLEVLRAMFPSGSVTGAPKVRAMEVIARLEPTRRGLYTGAYGYVAWDGSFELAMAIRVLLARNGEAHYFAGGGIVADSHPEAELEETRWKAAQIERLLAAGGRAEE